MKVTIQEINAVNQSVGAHNILMGRLLARNPEFILCATQDGRKIQPADIRREFDMLDVFADSSVHIVNRILENERARAIIGTIILGILEQASSVDRTVLFRRAYALVLRNKKNAVHLTEQLLHASDIAPSPTNDEACNNAGRVLAARNILNSYANGDSGIDGYLRQMYNMMVVFRPVRMDKVSAITIYDNVINRIYTNALS